ncbi:hypothetical protein GC163_23170 [bacterium]|nr:hypothetical protein [bacterium]
MTQADPRRFWGFYWVIAFLLLISPTSVALSESVFVLAPVDQSLIAAPRLWNVPLAEVLPVESYYWSRWGFSLFAASVISLLVGLVCNRFNSLVILSLLVGLSLSFQPREMANLACMVAWVALNHRSADRNTVQIARGSMLLLFAGLTSLELGIFVLVMMTMIWQSQRQTRFVNKAVVSGLLAGLLVTIIFSVPSFGAMFLRPLSWTWMNYASFCIPDLQPVLSLKHFHAGPFFLFLVICDALKRVCLCPETTWMTRVSAVLLASLGSLCQWYTSLATVALITFVPRSAQQIQLPASWLTPAVGGIIALGQLSLVFFDEGTSRILGSDGSRIVDVEHWPGQGAVFLTNLSQSHQWQSPKLRKQFPLLLSDRWDVGAEAVESYVKICGDLVAGKREPYRKTDGSWGGFQPFLLDHKVAVIVIDSSNLEAIRKTSLDPQWRILSIDAQRTTFGRFDRADTGPQAERAGRLLMHLEWPRPVLADTLDGTLELGSPADRRKVSMVLNAIRLPYAALKLLPEDSSWDTETVATWSYVELAQRSLRQAGTVSLTDHPRAMRGLQRISSSWWINNSDRKLARNCYASLTHRAHSTINLEASPAETQFRSGISKGDWSAAEMTLSEMPAATQRYFGVFLKSGSIHNLSDDLSQSIGDELPQHLQAEGWFLQAGLQLELGDLAAAKSSLERAGVLDQGNPYAALREFYSAQMQ